MLAGRTRASTGSERARCSSPIRISVRRRRFARRVFPCRAARPAKRWRASTRRSTARARERIVFLGDFLHAREGRAPETLRAINEWRSRRARRRNALVRGNHDKRAGDPPRELEMRCVDAPVVESAIRVYSQSGSRPMTATCSAGTCIRARASPVRAGRAATAVLLVRHARPPCCRRSVNSPGSPIIDVDAGRPRVGRRRRRSDLGPPTR